MNSSITAQSILPAPEPLLPPGPNPLDAEVDIEILKTVPKAFAIDCEDHANWLVRKVLGAREYAQRVRDWSARELARAAREEQTLMFLFGRQIEQWTRAEIEKLNGRRKSICLPAGTVGFRTSNPRLQVDDEQVVIAWAKQHVPSAVVIVEKLAKSELNRMFEATGEVPPIGAHIEPSCETFFVR
jgi:hypothetical protein